MLQRLLSPLEASPSGIKSALSWLAISLRPLSLVELQLLAGIDTRKDVLTGTALGSPEDVVRSSGNFLWVDNGVVRFRHSFVQQFIVDMLSQSRMLMPSKDAHRDLALRLLRAARPESRKFDTPTMDLARSSTFDEVFKADPLFEYATRYWVRTSKLSIINPMPSCRRCSNPTSPRQKSMGKGGRMHLQVFIPSGAPGVRRIIDVLELCCLAHEYYVAASIPYM